MLTLNGQLAALRAEKDAARDPALTAILNRSTADLQTTGIAERAKGVADRAPLFARPDLEGTTVRLRSILQRGPAILSFFRGRW